MAKKNETPKIPKKKKGSQKLKTDNTPPQTPPTNPPGSGNG